MNKKFNHYLTIWGIMFGLFLVAAIVVPNALKLETDGYAIGLIGTIIAYLGELACAKKVFDQDTLQKFFYNIPVLKILHGALYVMTIIGTACMVIPLIPAWVAAVACLLIFAITAIAVVKSTAAAEIVSDIDEKIAVSTGVIKQLRAKAQALTKLPVDEDSKTALKKISELLQYSDPVSSPAGATLEAQIAVRLEDLKGYIEKNSDKSIIQNACEKIEALLNERNRIIKANK